MYFCKNCGIVKRPHNYGGKICCGDCGFVLDEDNFSDEPTFTKDAQGQAKVAANRVNIDSNDYSLSRKRTLDEARDGIESIMNTLKIGGGDSIASPALALYQIALDRNFTKGRRKDRVEAACLYIICRVEEKPYLLVDFSEHLRINVYKLGEVFLELCQLLSLVEHPIYKKTVDPSLFMDRFTARLFDHGEFKQLDYLKKDVSETAIRIVASMKRDWMQTGRKPSGLCGAALYVSVLSYGLECSKSDIIKVVHIGKDTLTKRLIEFEDTESGNLTMEEFNMKADALKKEKNLPKPIPSGLKASSELLCKHKDEGIRQFAHRLCEECYKEFVELSGGLDGLSDPPAFRHAEMKRARAKEASAQLSDDTNSSVFPDQAENDSEVLQDITHDSSDDGVHEADDTFEESETLSDIDDTEVDCYLHNEEEKQLKKIIWEETNKEYLEEQAAKEAASDAATKAYEAQFSNCSEGFEDAQKLAAAAAAAVERSKKEKQQKRAAERKNLVPAQTALEATKQMLGKKRLSSRINYDVLEELFAESENSEVTKKSKIDDPMSDYDDDNSNYNTECPEIETIEDAYTDDGDDDEDNSLDYL